MFKPSIQWIVLVFCICLFLAGEAAAAASKTDRIEIRYVPPKNPEHQSTYTLMKQRGALEELELTWQKILV